MTQPDPADTIKVPASMPYAKQFVEFVTSSAYLDQDVDISVRLQRLTELLTMQTGAVLEIIKYLGTQEQATQDTQAAQ